MNHQSKPLIPGVYVPTVTFFKPVTEDLDLSTIASHAVRLAQAGVAGIATQGSNGEAVHLSHAERQTVTRTTRTALDDAGFANLPIIVGCGGQSTRETIQFCHEAVVSGGDYALILPPNYYKALFTSETIYEFFTTVADASPIPILIYNYPAAASGIDLSSDDIVALAKHPNIVGCKLTCGNTGKLARIAAATSAASPTNPPSATSGTPNQPFMCLGGSADFTLQTLIVGGSGIICGIGNVAPKACVRVFDRVAEGDLLGAKKTQEVVARGDWAAISTGIVGTKSALESYFGYGGLCRQPLPAPIKGDVVRFKTAFEEIVEYEKTL
jgi:4-hydroxy-2-oxoglutarate aldolase